MDRKYRHRKCRCCREFFRPDYRNGHHQLYCSKPECRCASKAASQRRWLSKPGNRDHFRGKENLHRVQQWRHAHPGYWKKSGTKAAQPEPPQVPANQSVAPSSLLVTQSTNLGTLQDVCLADHPVFIGLISMVTGSTLQEDIASTARRLEARGRDILGLDVSTQIPTAYDCQTSDST